MRTPLHALLLTMVAVSALAQAPKRSTPDTQEAGSASKQAAGHAPNVWTSYADGKEYESTVDKEAVMSSPAWNPSQPLPITLDKVLEIAKGELRKTVKDHAKWDLTSITAERLLGTEPQRWYFVVHFAQLEVSEATKGDRHPSMYFLVDAAGKPGKMKPTEKE